MANLHFIVPNPIVPGVLHVEDVPVGEPVNLRITVPAGVLISGDYVLGTNPPGKIDFAPDTHTVVAAGANVDLDFQSTSGLTSEDDVQVMLEDTNGTVVHQFTLHGVPAAAAAGTSGGSGGSASTGGTLPATGTALPLWMTGAGFVFAPIVGSPGATLTGTPSSTGSGGGGGGNGGGNRKSSFPFWWIIAIMTVVLVGVLGFFLGWVISSGEEPRPPIQPPPAVTKPPVEKETGKEDVEKPSSPITNNIYVVGDARVETDPVDPDLVLIPEPPVCKKGCVPRLYVDKSTVPATYEWRCVKKN